MFTPNFGNATANKTFAGGFTRLTIVAISGTTVVTCGSSTMTLPIGIITFFEAPNGRPHAEVSATTTGEYLYQEYR